MAEDERTAEIVTARSRRHHPVRLGSSEAGFEIFVYIQLYVQVRTAKNNIRQNYTRRWNITFFWNTRVFEESVLIRYLVENLIHPPTTPLL